ncbi:hypothetical protein PTKIN_Ptkin18bG0067400 [Pterospermum kingtungense]
MEILKHLQLLAFISCVSFAVLIHAQDQSGYISLDCGLPKDSNYTESTTDVNYISDAPYIRTGISKKISSEFRDGMPQQAWHLRSFPEGIRNCYNITLKKGDKYLIRAYFYYGNYDEKNDLPRFDMQLGPNFWRTVVLTNISYDSVMDVIYILPSNHLHICLVNTGNGVPFISSIELRLLPNSTYRTQAGSLVHFARFDVAPETSETFRYNEDVYDRIWWPYRRSDWTKINTSLTMDCGENDYQPPQRAMRTAGIPVNANSSLDFNINAPENSEIYVYMHIGEVEQLQANESRVFNISYNGDHWYGPYRPPYLLANTIYATSSLTGTKHQFSIYRIEDSTHPPILNAIEIYLVRNFSQSEALQKDVDAILNIKSMYGLKKNWEGDPCAPQDYLWEGLLQLQ